VNISIPRVSLPKLGVQIDLNLKKDEKKNEFAKF
jgi:hypothetical protein